MRACCQHHKSVFTYAAIPMSFVGMLASISDPISLIMALLSMLLVWCTMCCKLHKYILWLAAILALVAAVDNFFDVGLDQCFEGEGSNCRTGKAAKILDTSAGVIMIINMLLIFMIPHSSSSPSGSNNDNDPVEFETSRLEGHETA